jgi:hypothetical protein
MTDWTPAAAQIIVGKRATASQKSYFLSVNTTGTLKLTTSADGSTELGTDSTVATGVADGATKWVRATLQVNNGSSQRVNKFYTSDDGVSWTQLGTTVTTAGATSIFDSTSVLEIGSVSLGSNNLLNGTVYRAIVQSAYDTADNTTSAVFDADFSTQTADALAFTESSTNAATVTINTTRYSYGLPGVAWTNLTTNSLAANFDYYSPFIVTKSAVVDGINAESTAVTTNGNIRYAIYNADTNLQPTSLFTDFGDIAVTAATPAVYFRQVTPFTLQPGLYLLAFNRSVAGCTIRTYVGTGFAGPTPTPWFRRGAVSRSYAAFPSTGISWTTMDGSNTGTEYFARLRYKEA